MNELRAALLRYVWRQEQQEGDACPPAVLPDLRKQFGDDLVPGLIDCLSDCDSDVRLAAANFLFVVSPLPDLAVPALIECLSDEDFGVREAVAYRIADFAEIAEGAIPALELCLDPEYEFLRVVALTAIVRLDPDRTELLPEIRELLRSDDVTVQCVAGEFLEEMPHRMPFDEAAFQEDIRQHWKYQGLSEQVFWRFVEHEAGNWEIELAPVLQEFWGGKRDGKRTWAGFEIDLQALEQQPGIDVYQQLLVSRCEHRSTTPHVAIKGEYFGISFLLRIYLEPLPKSDVREVRDVLSNQVRAIEEKDDPRLF